MVWWLFLDGQLWWYLTFLAACHCLNLCLYLIVCRFTDMANKLSLSLSLSLSSWHTMALQAMYAVFNQEIWQTSQRYTVEHGNGRRWSVQSASFLGTLYRWLGTPISSPEWRPNRLGDRCPCPEQLRSLGHAAAAAAADTSSHHFCLTELTGASSCRSIGVINNVSDLPKRRNSRKPDALQSVVCAYVRRKLPGYANAVRRRPWSAH